MPNTIGPTKRLRSGLKPRIDWFALAFLGLALALMLFFFLAPLSSSILVSFYRSTGPGGIDPTVLTIENYVKFFDPFYLGILWRTLKLSAVITICCLLLAYPVAYYIAGASPRVQGLLTLVYLAPWFVNVAVKAFGWTLLLSPGGYINRLLITLGLIREPLALMWNELGIVIGLTHGHIVFMVLPLMASISGINPNLPLAAANLGARPWQVFRYVTVPLSLPGVVAGSVIVFVMSVAAFATPELLGGPRARVLSYIAYEQNITLLNWPFGAAIAVIILVIVSVLMVGLQRRVSRDTGRRLVR